MTPTTHPAPDTMTAGIRPMNAGLEGTVWNILDQTYVPKHLTESSMSWHTTLPVGTFVPPHIHPSQDEFLYILDGRFDLWLDGTETIATPGDLVRATGNVFEYPWPSARHACAAMP